MEAVAEMGNGFTFQSITTPLVQLQTTTGDNESDNRKSSHFPFLSFFLPIIIIIMFVAVAAVRKPNGNNYVNWRWGLELMYSS